MRVLHVINTGETGGGGEHLHQLLSGLRRQGIESAVAVGMHGPLVPRLRALGVPVTVIGPMGPRAAITLARQFRIHRPDLLHLHGSRSGLLGSLAARSIGLRPIVYTAHAFAFYRRGPVLLRWLAARAESVTAALSDRMICLSAGDLDVAAGRGVSVSRATVIPNGIDPARFVGAPDRRGEFGIVRGAPVVGMIARLVPQKDPLTFVQMAKIVVGAMPQTRFLLVGDGPLRAAVADAVRRLGLTESIRLTGFRQDVPELLATMDVVVLTSLWEGMPIILLEAMAAGKPVVAAQTAGTLETVVPGETGLLISPQDWRECAGAVLELLNDPRRRAEMGSQGRARVERYFTIDRMVGATAGVYRAAVSAVSTPSG